MRHQALWFRTRHSKYGLQGVRAEEASHPGPVSRYFALTEVDSDAEDSNSHVSEVSPVEPERSGRRYVIFAAQTQVDPVDPIVVDEDLEDGSDHSSDTESIDIRGGTSDAEGEVEVVSPPEAPVPTVSVPRDSPTVSSGWLKWIWKSFSNSVRV